MWKMVLVTILGLIAAIAGALIYGARRWESATEELQAGLEAARLPDGAGKYHPDELAGLPAPVQRYFRAVLTEGQPIVSAAAVTHTGTFNMGETTDQWQPFESTQRVVTRRPGFVWDARIHMAPGLAVHVHDAYLAGQGVLRARLFGLISVMEQPATPELARGELMRYFAETAWYPTALLPGQGVAWEAVDDSSARATLQDGDISLTLLFRFNDQDLIESVRAEARGRTVDGVDIPTPWEGRWRNYELRAGMRVPIEGEVAWLLPEGPKPYWRGRITGLSYEFAK